MTPTQPTPGRAATYGALGGALGALVFIPIMLTLGRTPWRVFAEDNIPGLAASAGQFSGWVLHLAVAALFGVAFGLLALRGRVANPYPWALSWAGLFLGLSVAFVVYEQVAVPVWGVLLEILGHAVYGLVLAATYLYGNFATLQPSKAPTTAREPTP